VGDRRAIHPGFWIDGSLDIMRAVTFLTGWRFLIAAQKRRFMDAFLVLRRLLLGGGADDWIDIVTAAAVNLLYHFAVRQVGYVSVAFRAGSGGMNRCVELLCVHKKRNHLAGGKPFLKRGQTMTAKANFILFRPGQFNRDVFFGARHTCNC
jgi:hypothetical protein